MILTCPNCGTRYQTDASKFAPPGRNVRCAKCGQTWFQPPPEAEIEPEPAPESEPVQTVEEEEVEPSFAANFAPQSAAQSTATYTPVRDEAPRRRGGFGRAIGWLLLIAIVAGIVWAAVHYRQTIAQLWPKTASVYAALGMKVNTLGLDIRDVTPSNAVEGSQPMLEVKGRVVNVSDHAITVPEMRAALVDAEAREIYHWNFDAGLGSLGPGASGDFTARLTAPPQGAKDVRVRFARPGEQ